MSTMDVEPEIIVEDGEITDDSDVEYTPLERPVSLMNSHRSVINNFSDEESERVSSDSDSDKGFTFQAKRTKLKIKKPNKPLTKPKKYDIWSSRVQEDVLAETLVSCDVSRIDRSRNVESYDYSASNRYKDSYSSKKHKHGKKRSNNDRKNVKLRLGKRDDSTDDEVNKAAVRKLLGLVTTINDTEEEIAKDIANKLCEEKDNLICRIVQTVGKEKAIELFNETQRIEADGGMLIMNRTRRRTPGGVYIFLLKRDDDVTTEQQSEIFKEERKMLAVEQKQKHRAKLRKIKSQLNKNSELKEELPELIPRSELYLQDAKEVVNNPPPSPASEEHDSIQPPIITPNVTNLCHRNIPEYADDFLDIGVGNDMDMF